MGKFQYGGQAVIEGVMMRGPKKMGLAVRKSDGEIAVITKNLSTWSQKYPILKWPFLRGMVAFIESLVMGMNTLTESARLAGEGEDEQLTKRDIFIAITLAIALVIGIFVIIPTLLAFFARPYVGQVGQSMLESTLRILFFLGYILIIARIPDIKRVFQYHGAEHKTIFAYEQGLDLTPENARKQSRLHPRCGTSFLVFLLILSIIIFSFISTPNVWLRLGLRILLLPVITGLGYELIKFSSKHCDNVFVKMLITPGLWMQKITTAEPDDGQLEVAIKALKLALEEDDKPASLVAEEARELAAIEAQKIALLAEEELLAAERAELALELLEQAVVEEVSAEAAVATLEDVK
ncbi:MAG: DUF1385 domain-containing protein [Clostridia bacterium]